LKILISAIACHPTWGSESAFGWNAVVALSSRHELWVLTSKGAEGGIIDAQTRGRVPPNVKFEFVGQHKPYHPNRLLARFQDWHRLLRWNRDALPVARNLASQIDFDLVHHVTYSTWRVAPPVHSLGVPLIWGPLGGGERFPARFYSVLSPIALLFEFVRSVSNFVSSRSSAVRKAARRAAHVLASNGETLERLRRLRASDKNSAKLSAAFFRQDQIARFIAASEAKSYEGRLRLFAGGNLEGRKGVALAIEALSIVRSRGIPFAYTYGGYGPELRHLRSLVNRLGLAEQVTFVEGFRGDEYLRQLADSHIYLLPSLRENAGITLMEAMLAGCAPIVIAAGGPGEIVNSTSGVAIPLSSPRKVANKIADEIVRLHFDRSRLQKIGVAAQMRIASEYSDESYLRTIEAVYQSVVAQRSPEKQPT
jgi:glycosyltransferase involved in cell wall biosynthesis